MKIEKPEWSPELIPEWVWDDSRIVLTMDGGASSFRFTAIRGVDPVSETFRVSSRTDDLDTCLNRIIAGFEQVGNMSPNAPVALCFGFPGPANYTTGVIGDLENLPFFRGGVPLGPILSTRFGVPVYIRNDADLFTYGEYHAGLQAWINRQWERTGLEYRSRNLVGLTFGTGFGGGYILDGCLHPGDNSAQGEINRMRNRLYPDWSVEESVSIRGLKRVYCRESGQETAPEPAELYRIATGKSPGHRDAARHAFMELAIVAADAAANAVTMIDGNLVFGGGISGAWPVFLERFMAELNRPFQRPSGEPLPRMEVTACNLMDREDRDRYFSDDVVHMSPEGYPETVEYRSFPRIAVSPALQETTTAVHRGAWILACKQLDSEKNAIHID